MSTLHLVIPALEAVHKAWISRAEKPKYAAFTAALEAGIAKITTYYNKTELTDAYIVAMCTYPELLICELLY